MMKATPNGSRGRTARLLVIATLMMPALFSQIAMAQTSTEKKRDAAREAEGENAGSLAAPAAPAAPTDPAAPGAREPKDASPKTEAPGMGRSAALVGSLTVFVLAVFVGFEIITKVPPTLHTPLMSGSNAISGITIVGALVVTGGAALASARLWGFLAVTLATINVVGGFLVTHRMLSMFNKPRPKRKAAD